MQPEAGPAALPFFQDALGASHTGKSTVLPCSSDAAFVFWDSPTPLVRFASHHSFAQSFKL